MITVIVHCETKSEVTETENFLRKKKISCRTTHFSRMEDVSKLEKKWNGHKYSEVAFKIDKIEDLKD